MKKARKVILILFLALFIVSCRPQPDLSRDFPETETWGETFEVFWKKMSTNYLFWSLDYDEGRGWDSVYDEYKEKFDALGLVEDSTRSTEEQKENTLNAYRYFFEITKNLSDGHYALKISDNSDNAISLSPSSYRSLKNYGFSDGDIFKFLYDSEYRSNPIFSDWLEYCMENTATIMEKIFGLPSDVVGYNDASANGALAEQYHFSDMKYFNTSKGFHIVLGRNSEGIVYFSFSGFNFYNYFDEDAGDNGVVKIVRDFFTLISDEETKGVIIDLRGNTGGFITDMSNLWTAFMPSDIDSVTIGYTRRKASENRTDYNAWIPFVINRSDLFEYGNFNKDLPIAIILNGSSISCAEMSTCFFMALRDDYGYDVRLFGEPSCGGMGSLNYDSEEMFNGGISSISPYVSLLNTPYCQMKYLDGICYEGKGLPVDENVSFDPDAFDNELDPRLSATLEWISST